ncbi:hypothetical protein HDU96_004886 [Phlyctochytrium bullatum]|nr:hypothetical protein HDU96_004886 [Phlyctochytrium bullatum]
MASPSSIPSSTLTLPSTATPTAPSHPTYEAWRTRTPSDISEGLRIWSTAPLPTRNTLGPYSRYAQLSAPFPYYIRAERLGPCPPQDIATARNGQKLNPVIFNSCGVDDLELALRMYFSHWVRTETPIDNFPARQATISFVPTSSLPLPRFLPAIYGGLAINVSQTFFQVSAPDGVNPSAATVEVIGTVVAHALALMLLAVAFFKGLYPVDPVPPVEEEVEWDVVLTELRPGGGARGTGNEQIPAYSAPEDLEVQTPVQGGEANKGAATPAKTNVMYI